MTQNSKLKLIISYSHLDEDHVNNFTKHLATLRNNGLVDEWYDRKIVGGERYQEVIDENFEAGDVICLCISANFLNSHACRKEIATALRLEKEKGASVVPIILSHCMWKKEPDISPIQAFPKDGTPITDFPNSDLGWTTVCEGLEKVIQKRLEQIKVSLAQEALINNLQLTDEFQSFLRKIELLENAHSRKNVVVLDDVFVYPELDRFDNFEDNKDKNFDEVAGSEQIIANFTNGNNPKILISGENQSGKTTLCKKFFAALREKNLVPVYIADKDGQHSHRLETRIVEAFEEQYGTTISLEQIDRKKVIPIVDNFHLVQSKHKERYIQELASYHYQIVVVDDIFNLNLSDENLTNSFSQFRIKEFSPALRNQLLKKWIDLSDKKSRRDEREVLKEIDEKTELVENSLGTGIMPMFPFFIMSVISIHETSNPLDKITSQGHCYQALIFVYLTRQGVNSDQIGTYFNFLTELAFFFYKENKYELSSSEFEGFMKQYLNKYYLPIERESFLNNLRNAHLIRLNGSGNYLFCYEYIYYFFVAKYLADDPKKHEKIIEKIINNLHKDENAYIAVFISHHSKDNLVLDEIMLNAWSLFDSYEPATLCKKELAFFDEQSNEVVNAVMSIENRSSQERERRLEAKKVSEQNSKKLKSKKEEEATDNALEKDLRRSVKTVEVMGRILKNRAGSLERTRLEEILEEAIQVYLRILTSFFDFIKEEERREEIISFLSERMDKFIQKKEEEKKAAGEKVRELSKEDREKMSRKIFWNANFSFVYGIINKIISSIGSDQLLQAIETIADKKDTPAYFLVKHGISMWYDKNLQTDNIIKKITKDDGFSEIAKRAMRFMIVNHCMMHPIEFDEKQKINSKLGIPLKSFNTKKS